MKVSCCWMYAIGKYGFPPTLGNMLHAIEEMKELGFDFIELEGVAYENLEHVLTNRETIANHCRQVGVQVVNIAPVVPDLVSLDADAQRRAFGYFERTLDTCLLFECPNIWIDSFRPPLEWIKGTDLTEDLVFGESIQARLPSGFSWPAFWGHFVEAIRRAADMARERGITLLIEPRVGETTSNADSLLALLNSVRSNNIKIIFDTAHQYAQKEVLPLSVAKLAPHIGYVHIADNDGTTNRHFPPGDGTIDWESLFMAFKQCGYKGFFGVDLERIPDLEGGFKRTKRFLEELGQRLRI